MPRSPWLSSCVSFRRRGLLARLRRRLTGSPSLDVRLAGYGIGVPAAGRMREAATRAEWVSPLPLGDYGQVSLAYANGIPTHILRPSPSKSASLNTDGNTAATGDASIDAQLRGVRNALAAMPPPSEGYEDFGA